MRTNTYGAFIALALMVAATSCSEEMIKSPIANQGDEVNFGAQLSSPKSKTYYGEPIDNNGTRVFPIYWNDLAKGYDKIFIYAPDGLSGRNQSYYSVRPTEANQTTPAAVVKTDEVGVQWADKPTDFYSFYPGNTEFNISAEGTKITATMPGNQQVTYAQPLVDELTSGKVVEALPDMTCCMMVAKTPAVSPTTEAISLQFDPLSSVLDVTVNGPDESNTATEDNLHRITSVAVTANGQICGEFTYDYSTGEVVCNSTSEYDKTVIVSTLGEDEDGDLVGVPLRHDQQLKVKLFVIPNPDATEMTVSVVTSNSQVWRKTLTMSNFKPRQIHPVTLPQLVASEAEFDYRTWISQLDPRIYISELSLPGSALSFNTSEYVNPDVDNRDYFITQTGNIDDQFNAGCRVFQAHFWLVPETSSIDGQVGRFALTTSNGYDTGQRLVPTLRALREQMEGVHSNGFCVVMLSDYEILDQNHPAFDMYDINDVYNRFATLTDQLDEVGILPESEIGPNTTIADVRGKIILKVQLNGGVNEISKSSTASTVVNAQNDALNKIKGWEAVNGSKALFNWWGPNAGNSVYYAPMRFGGVGTFNIDNPAHTSGLFGTTANKATVSMITEGLAYMAADQLVRTSNMSSGNRTPGSTDCEKRTKEDMSDGMWLMYAEQANAAGDNTTTCNQNIGNVVNAINETYDSNTHNKFYMTYCGGVGKGPQGRNTVYADVDLLTTQFNTTWLSAIDAVKNKPYGWVLFNKVVKDDPNNEIKTKECIKKVISNNNDINFKLQRKKDAAKKTRPTGDIQGANPGGSLF